MPALEKEVELSIWVMLDVMAVRALFCHARMMTMKNLKMQIFCVILDMQEFVAKVCFVMVQ